VLLADLLGQVAGCFPRRETRQCCGQMVNGLLMELDDHNCQPVAEAIGHRGPHRLQHLPAEITRVPFHATAVQHFMTVTERNDRNPP
jgi:hypothetical protein